MIQLTDAQFAKMLDQQRRLSIRTNPPDVMSAEEAAVYLDMHIDTVRAMVAEGALPARKSGRILKFLRDDLRGWVAKCPRTQ
jgi:excisionase family DNA binding protein